MSGPLPKVTVITYVHVNRVNDRLSLFREGLQSVRDQGYDNYEHVVIDDGSDIDLGPVVADFPKVRLVRKPGTGIISSTYTFNLGQRVATGDACILLPSDDLSVPGGIGALAALLAARPDAQSAIGCAIYEDPKVGEREWRPDPEKIEVGILDKNHINGCAIMWRRTARVLADLPPNYTGFCADYDLFGMIARSGPVAYSDHPVVRYRWAADSTRNKTRGRSIASPRKEDALFCQYTKPARLDFVKARLRRANTVAPPGQDVEPLNLPAIPEALTERLALRAIARDWGAAWDCLKPVAGMADGLAQARAAVAAGKVIRVSELTLPALVTMNLLRDAAWFDLVWSGDGFDWRLDLCPMPAIRQVTDADGTRRDALMTWLGFGQ